MLHDHNLHAPQAPRRESNSLNANLAALTLPQASAAPVRRIGANSGDPIEPRHLIHIKRLAPAFSRPLEAFQPFAHQTAGGGAVAIDCPAVWEAPEKRVRFCWQAARAAVTKDPAPRLSAPSAYVANASWYEVRMTLYTQAGTYAARQTIVNPPASKLARQHGILIQIDLT